MRYNGVEILNAKNVIRSLIEDYELSEEITVSELLKIIEEHDRKHMITGVDLSGGMDDRNFSGK